MVKKIFKIISFEEGQILPLVVFVIIAVIAMSALVLDGAVIMSHRRTAQAAADAAALAGAEYLCPPVYNQNHAIVESTNYVTLNNAVVSDIYLPEGNTIHVEVTVESPSFFAGIFDQSQLAANASAEASCTPLSTGVGTLPLVSPCVIPQEGDPDYGENVCRVSYYDEDLTLQENIDNGNMAILMTSEPSWLECYDEDHNPNGVICVDGEGGKGGKKAPYASAARGWVSLDGTGGASALKDWINGDETPPTISQYSWLSNSTAFTASAFHALKGREGYDFRVPIYDRQCPKSPPSAQCPSLYNGATDNESLLRTGNHHNYRVVGFGFFRVTCVQTDKKNTCPFRDHVENKTGESPPGNSVWSIEGYFHQGTFPSGGGEGVDHGLYVVHLK